MAGNPFRRSGAANIAIPPVTSFNANDNDPSTTSAASTKKKQVTIQTPPAFDDDEQHGRRLSASDSANRADSPPPPARESEISDSSDDSADSDMGEARLNTRRNSGSLAPPTAFPGIFDRREPGEGGGSTMKAPYNPFARTLATTEADYRSKESMPTNGHDRGQKEGTPNRPAMMDVDAFKNILLTGSAIPSHDTSPAPHGRRPQDVNSNTGSSSIFDSNYSLRGPLSPGMDGFDDDYASASPNNTDDDNDDDDDHDFTNERKNLMGQGRSDDFAPPAPPKPGRAGRGPQTVSFADFDQSIPHDWQPPVRGPSPLPTVQPASILRPKVHRMPSDLNKPLPPPPNAGPSDPAESSAHPPSVPDKDVSTTSPAQMQHEAHSPVEPQLEPQPEVQVQQQIQPAPLPQLSEDISLPKKVPPPPPVSRRHQVPNTTNRPRSSSNLSTSSSTFTPFINDPPPQTQAFPEPIKSESSTPKGTAAPVPPPPPSRKPHPTVSPPAKSSSPQTQSTASENIPPPQAPKVVPPPPPRRHLSRTHDSSRTSSPAQSLRTAPSPATTAPTSTSSGSAPPPPPPPRRGTATTTIGSNSARSSLDSARRQGSYSGSTTGEVPRASFDSGGGGGARRTGSNASAAVEEGKDGVTERDVLADMRAFEEEIAALRKKGAES